MSDEIDYPGGRKARIFDGFVSIVPSDCPDRPPLTCPVCDFMMRSHDDDSSYAEFQCCYRCALTWAHCDRNRWANGWRPSNDEIETAKLNRPRLSMTFRID